MARRSKEEKLTEAFNLSKTLFDEVQSAMRDERLQCLQDRRFYAVAGAQWEGNLGLQFENKPKMEVNKISTAIARAKSEYRNNRISPNFVPNDGTEDAGLADVLNGLMRSDEQLSTAQEAYDSAFEDAVAGGFGAFRLRAVYEDELNPDEDKQRISIEPVFDADSCVFYDLDAKRMDKADAKHCWVLYSLSYTSFLERFGKDYSAQRPKQKLNVKDANGTERSPVSVNKLVHQQEFDWLTPHVVFIAEYYHVEVSSQTMVTFTGLAGNEEQYDQEDLDEDETIEQRLLSRGYKRTKEEKKKAKKVHKYIMDGQGFLADEGFIAGDCIPIIPVYGQRTFIENVERCYGFVRTTKDLQRILNMQYSRLVEIASISTIEKPIFTAEQIVGHEERWEEDNVVNRPFLTINSLRNAQGDPVMTGPQSYTHAPAIPQALNEILQLAGSDIQDLLGRPFAAEELVSNVSGKAVEAVHNKKTMDIYIYLSNMAKALRRGGEVYLSMAKDLYTQKDRKMRTLNQQGQSDIVKLNTGGVVDGRVQLKNNIEKASFDVTVDVGPTSTTQKQAIVREMTGLLQYVQDPETAKIITMFTFMNMDGEGIDDLRAWARAGLVQAGAAKPTPEEAKNLGLKQQQPDPNDLILQATVQVETAKAKLIQAQTLKELAAVKQSDAKAMLLTTETAQLLQLIEGMDNADRDAIVASIKQMKQMQIGKQ
jgi:hypothetical protein